MGIMLSIFLTYAFSFHVILDPGHGGMDTGASYHGLQEAKITLQIAKDLKDLLEEKTSAKVSLTRKKNTQLSLKARANTAHEQKGDLFISIHTNSSPSKRAKGVEIYFENQLRPDEDSLFLAYREEYIERDQYIPGRPPRFKNKYKPEVAAILDDLSKTKYGEHSLSFSKKIQKHWLETEKTKIRIRQAPFQVISSINMPSVLVEVGFLTNQQDSQKLATRSYQKKIAQILYKAIEDWKDKWTKQRSKL